MSGLGFDGPPDGMAFSFGPATGRACSCCSPDL